MLLPSLLQRAVVGTLHKCRVFLCLSSCVVANESAAITRESNAWLRYGLLVRKINMVLLFLLSFSWILVTNLLGRAHQCCSKRFLLCLCLHGLVQACRSWSPSYIGWLAWPLFFAVFTFLADLAFSMLIISLLVLLFGLDISWGSNCGTCVL